MIVHLWRMSQERRGMRRKQSSDISCAKWWTLDLRLDSVLAAHACIQDLSLCTNMWSHTVPTVRRTVNAGQVHHSLPPFPRWHVGLLQQLQQHSSAFSVIPFQGCIIHSTCFDVFYHSFPENKLLSVTYHPNLLLAVINIRNRNRLSYWGSYKMCGRKR